MSDSIFDVYEDLVITRGSDFEWGASLTPLDLTSCTSQLEILGLARLPATIKTTRASGSTISEVTFKALAAATVLYAAGTYLYNFQITFADGSQWRFGHGKVTVV